jgi:hypothetical protein
MIGRLGDAVCNPHRTHGADEKHGFSDLASKRWQQVGDLGLKSTVMVFSFGPQNQEEEVCRFPPQN